MGNILFLFSFLIFKNSIGFGQTDCDLVKNGLIKEVNGLASENRMVNGGGAADQIPGFSGGAGKKTVTFLEGNTKHTIKPGDTIELEFTRAGKTVTEKYTVTGWSDMDRELELDKGLEKLKISPTGKITNFKQLGEPRIKHIPQFPEKQTYVPPAPATAATKTQPTVTTTQRLTEPFNSANKSLVGKNVEIEVAPIDDIKDVSSVRGTIVSVSDTEITIEQSREGRIFKSTLNRGDHNISSIAFQDFEYKSVGTTDDLTQFHKIPWTEGTPVRFLRSTGPTAGESGTFIGFSQNGDAAIIEDASGVRHQYRYSEIKGINIPEPSRGQVKVKSFIYQSP